MLLVLRLLGLSGQTGPSGSANPFYIVREEDGTSVLTLEDGGGALLTEETV